MAVNIGESIRSIRTTMGITQDDLAAKLHLTKQTISNYERGIREPSFEHLIAIADALNVSPSIFFLRDTDNCILDDVSYAHSHLSRRLGEFISYYRNEHSISQRQFAAKCGDVTNGYISMLEHGVNPNNSKPLTPSIVKLKAIAKGLDMSLNELLLKIYDMPISLERYSPDVQKCECAYSEPALRIARVYNALPPSGQAVLDAFADFIEETYIK